MQYKFRGLRKDGKGWIHGQLCLSDTKAYIVYDDDYTVSVNCCGKTLIADRFFEVDPKTVGMWTGLCDKNGVEIYEGDIVRRTCMLIGAEDDFTGTVIFECAAFMLDNPGENEGRYLWDDIQELDVLGNIHEGVKE